MRLLYVRRFLEISPRFVPVIVLGETERELLDALRATKILQDQEFSEM